MISNEEKNPIANVEELEEGNYNMIDGIPNNGFGEKQEEKLIHESENATKEIEGLKIDLKGLQNRKKELDAERKSLGNDNRERDGNDRDVR